MILKNSRLQEEEEEASAVLTSEWEKPKKKEEEGGEERERERERSIVIHNRCPNVTCYEMLTNMLTKKETLKRALKYNVLFLLSPR